jgi:hypothetical protein
VDRWIGRWPKERSGRRRSAVSTTSPKPWVRAADPAACPVPEKERAWIERWLRWCAEEFGDEALHGRVALPGPEFTPPGFNGGQAETEELVARVGAVMGVRGGVTVHLFESADEEQTERHIVGSYRRVLGRSLIELDRREAVRPIGFTGIVAHELAHVRLRGDARIGGLAVNGERLTDLLTVFLGMGVFTANAACLFPRSASARGYSVLPMADLTDRMLTGVANEPTRSIGYLSEREFGYALAYWCVLRGESDPAWARRLSGGVRDVFRRGLRHLAARAD